MKALILIGGLVVVALLCVGIFYIVRNVRLDAAGKPKTIKRKP